MFKKAIVVVLGILLVGCGQTAKNTGSDGSESDFVQNEFEVGEWAGDPDVAVFQGTDRFICVWYPYDADGTGYNIHGKIYDANGVVTTEEFVVNETVLGSQSLPAAASLSNGNAIVTWRTSGEDGDGYGVHGIILDSSGVTVSSQFQVNTYTTGSQHRQAVAGLTDGRFVVVWQSDAQDGEQGGIFGQIFTAAGAKDGPEFMVNTTTANTQEFPDVCVLSGGGFLIVWTSKDDATNYNDICAQRYDSAGDRVGSEFVVNSTTDDHQAYAAATMLTNQNGSFVVTWMSNLQDGSMYGIYARWFDANANPLGSEFRMNTTTENSQVVPDICAMDDGGFVLAWTSNHVDPNTIVVRYRNFSTSTIGSETILNEDAAESVEDPQVASLGNGRFVTVWSSYNPGRIKARIVQLD